MDLELKLMSNHKGYETSIRYKARIDEAEEIFDDLVELILEREYSVSTKSSINIHPNHRFSREIKNGSSLQI